MFWTDKAYRPSSQVVVTDVCVPISRLAECVAETQKDIKTSRLIAPLFGHVGDGNIHAVVSVMMDDADEIARAKSFVSRLTACALAMDATCTGEHGVGDGKNAVDPLNLMNPGRIE